MPDPVFLTLSEVIEVHSDQIRRHGGRDGLRDWALLLSALAQPEASFAAEWLHKDLFDMAGAYAYHICQNHPFIDGNKRAALACALVFLEVNGIGLLDPKGLLHDALIRVASGGMKKTDLSDLFRTLPKDRR
ncbi:MAG: type II toxin-antitoxin system death-on-curing family toxin [Candidatus Omnitrophica bacterium]|nr:type II toxin-antitoxin system death-on-curing family toxin [Candidatus Omnitrophota bacterium]